jgi:hypothetical protein
MNTSDSSISPNASARTNGSGAAAILAAAIGSFALAVLACAGDKSAAVKACLFSIIQPGSSPVAYQCYCPCAAQSQRVADISAIIDLF